MKVFSRKFTLMEKVLLGVLVLILLGLVYYRFVDQEVRASIANSEAEIQQLQTELNAVELRVAHLQSVQASLDALEASGDMTWMGSYNNSQEELAFLNEILADTLNYSISFSNVTRSGDQIRRKFVLQYQTLDYAAAREILTRLCEGKNRCLVGDVKCTIGADGRVTMNESATFYETMVGGEPDAGLPADSAKANN